MKKLGKKLNSKINETVEPYCSCKSSYCGCSGNPFDYPNSYYYGYSYSRNINRT